MTHSEARRLARRSSASTVSAIALVKMDGCHIREQEQWKNCEDVE